MNRTLCLLIAACISTAALAQPSTDEYCRMVQNYAREVTPQLPMKMDVATTWVSISAIYGAGQCRIYHGYLLDSEVLVQSAAQMESMEPAEVQAKLQSEEGMERLKASVRDSLRRRVPEMMDVPNVVFQADYASKGPLESFTVELTTGGH